MMRRLTSAFLALGLLTAAPLAAVAQGTIQQSGPVTIFHAPAWYGSGVQMDGGTPATPFLNSMGLFGGPNCPFGVNSLLNPGASALPYAQFSVCQTGATTTFNFQGVNGQAAPSVVFNIGGVLYPFPSSGPTPPSPMMQASQNITAPALVNVSSTFQIAPANAAAGLPANGYVTASVTSGAFGQVFFAGLVSGLSGLAGGTVFLSPSSPGGVTQTPPASGSGNYVQPVGFAVSSGSFIFNPGSMNGPL